LFIKDKGEENVFYCYKAAEKKLYEELIYSSICPQFYSRSKNEFGELQWNSGMNSFDIPKWMKNLNILNQL